MKKTVLLSLIVFLTFALTTNAQLLLEENFDYGASANSDITVVAPTWERHSGTAGPAYSELGLSYSGYVNSGIGGALSFTHGSSGTNDGDVNKQFISAITTDDTLYASFLIELESARTGDYFLHLGPTIIGTTFRCRIYAKDSVDASGWKIGISKSSSTAFYDDLILSYNQTYLVVAKYIFSTSAADDDQVSLYVYESGVPASEPGAPLVTIGLNGTGVGSDPSELGSIAIRQGTNTPTGKVDGIRISTSWSEAPIPVELTSFSASVVQNKAVLNWATATETNNSGFEIQRRSDNSSFKRIGFVEGNGTTSEKSNYSFTDSDVTSGKYYYRLKQIDYDGTFAYSNSVMVDVNLIKSYQLAQNFPNPFNPSTTIKFALPVDAKISVKIFNILGKEVASVINDQLSAGQHDYQINLSNLSSGVYFYTIKAVGMDGSTFSSTKKMTLMK